MHQFQHYLLAAWAVVAMLLLSQTGSAQQTPPAIEWQKSLGGSGNDVATSIAQTSDGGYIVAGYSRSTNGDVIGNPGFADSPDYWIVKLTSIGVIEWQKSLGGSYATSIAQTNDGGYIVAGYIIFTDVDATGQRGNLDYWIVKLTSMGGLEWQKTLGGSLDDLATSIVQTGDGGYIVAGHSSSFDGDVTGHHGLNNHDYWIVKLTGVGKLEWQKSLGGSIDDLATSIAQTSDGGYIVAGYSGSNNGDVVGRHGRFDGWVVKLTSTGEIEWQRPLGGSENEWATSIAQTSDSGYIVAGRSRSSDGDLTGHYGSFTTSDSWIVKLTNTGQLQWQQAFGGSKDDGAASIAQTSDGGYIVAGYSYSNDGDLTGHHRLSDSTDYWIVKLTGTGKIKWKKLLGGSENDLATSIAQTSDGGYIIAGYSYSNDGDLTSHYGTSDSSDFWIVKLAPDTSSAATATPQPEPSAILSTISILPNPAQNTAVLKITSDAESEYTIELVSSIGEVVKRQSVNLGIGDQEVELREMESLPSGSYEVLVRRGSSPVARGRFVVVGK